MTEQQKVEFINGHIIMHSPVKKRYNQVNLSLAKLLSAYVDTHELGFVGIEKILISLTRNDYEPDICYFSQEKAEKLTEDQMRFPAPGIIVEVLSTGTEAHDRGVKFKDYEAHGVQEYWMVDSERETLEQYALVDGSYELILKAKDGTLKSKALPGFEIPVRAMFDGLANLNALRRITHV